MGHELKDMMTIEDEGLTADGAQIYVTLALSRWLDIYWSTFSVAKNNHSNRTYRESL
jgi:hypothetical protein